MKNQTATAVEFVIEKFGKSARKETGAMGLNGDAIGKKTSLIQAAEHAMIQKHKACVLKQRQLQRLLHQGQFHQAEFSAVVKVFPDAVPTVGLIQVSIARQKQMKLE